MRSDSETFNQIPRFVVVELDAVNCLSASACF